MTRRNLCLTSGNADRQGSSHMPLCAAQSCRTPLSTGTARAQPSRPDTALATRPPLASSTRHGQEPTVSSTEGRPLARRSRDRLCGLIQSLCRLSVRFQGGPKTGRTGGRLGACPALALTLPCRAGRVAGRLARTQGMAAATGESSQDDGQGGTAGGAADRFPTCTGPPRGASRRAIAGRQVPARPPVRLRGPAPAQVRNRPAPTCRWSPVRRLWTRRRLARPDAASTVG
jgi:hypothetical protein